MRIAWIAAGAGRMWCGACARDLCLVRALMARGQDISVIPVYLPLRTEGDDPSAGQPVISGGIGTWLREHVPGYGLVPRWADRALSSRAVLGLIAACASATRPSQLGRLTVSMLRGAEGRQRAAVDELVDHLRVLRPERIHLTNSLLLGYAPALRQRLGVPVDCSLQGEEVFVGDLGQPWTGEAQRLMRGHAAAVARFWSPHGRHADAMAVWLDIARDRIAVVPPAVDPGAYPARSTVPAEPIIGHLGVLVWRKGADVVAEAVRRLSRPCTLRFAGQEPNRSYRRQVRRLAPAAAFLGELSPEAKRTFLAGSRLVVLGSRIPEERAMIALESLCMGVPVVAPAAGIVPDLVASGCVRTYAPGDPADLARVLDEALAQPGWDGRDSPAWIAAHHAPQVAADAAEAALAG